MIFIETVLNVMVIKVFIFGNGAKTSLWDSPWLLGRKPKDTTPLVYEALRRKKWKVWEALKENAWIFKINYNSAVSGDHFRKFLTLWMLVHNFPLDVQTEDVIISKHANDGIYSAATAYKAQFLALPLSTMDLMVWKVCSPLSKSQILSMVGSSR